MCENNLPVKEPLEAAIVNARHFWLTFTSGRQSVSPFRQTFYIFQIIKFSPSAVFVYA